MASREAQLQRERAEENRRLAMRLRTAAEALRERHAAALPGTVGLRALAAVSDSALLALLLQTEESMRKCGRPQGKGKGKAAAGNAKPVARHVRVRLVLAGGKPRASACLLVRPRTRLQRLLRSAERYLDVERSVQCVRVHGQHVDVTPTRRLRDLPRPKPDGELVIELDAS